jgi:hypothetical protein
MKKALLIFGVLILATALWGRLVVAALSAVQVKDVDPTGEASKRVEIDREVRELLDGRTPQQKKEDQEVYIEALKDGMSGEQARELAYSLRQSRYLASLAEEGDVVKLVENGEIYHLVTDIGFRHFPNAAKIARTYEVSLRTFRIRGLHQDGTVDVVTASGRSLIVARQNYAAHLPRPASQYRQVTVESNDKTEAVISMLSAVQEFGSGAGYGAGTPSVNDRAVVENFTRTASGWVLQKNTDVPAFIRQGSQAGSFSAVKIFSVKRAKDHTILRLSTVGGNGGEQMWIVASADHYDATAEINAEIRRASAVIHDGDDLPEEWMRALYSGNLGGYIRKSDRSSNITDNDLKQAASLGSKNFRHDSTSVFNALPAESSLFWSRVELLRMGLDMSDHTEWASVRQEVLQTTAAVSLPVKKAVKTEVLEEFGAGKSDVVLIVAHSEGGKLYLPGRNGEYISIDDLDRIARPDVPNRIVVLVTCQGGGVNSQATSMSEAILRNRLARTVYATPHNVDARTVGDLLTKLFASNQPVHKTLFDRGFVQIVFAMRRLASREG